MKLSKEEKNLGEKAKYGRLLKTFKTLIHTLMSVSIFMLLKLILELL